MKYMIRVDASTLIGTGHVMRCLTLANALKQGGHEVEFICRAYPGNLISWIQQQGFTVYEVAFGDQEAYQQQPFSDDYAKWLWVSQAQEACEILEILKNQTPDYLITDHYSLDREWERKMRPYVNKLMVIDDLANRPHDCDVLLDQNFYLDLEHRYDDWVPPACLKLLGPRYALIRPEFFEIREQRRALGKFESHPIQNILIYMGGADPQNFTEQVIVALLKIPTIKSYHVDVVVGVSNPHQDQIKALCVETGLHYHCQPSYYKDLLAHADVAVGAGGSSALERCAVGLPGLIFAFAQNQKKISADLNSIGAQWYLAEVSELSTVIPKITNKSLESMRKVSLNLFDGHQTVAEMLSEI